MISDYLLQDQEYITAMPFPLTWLSRSIKSERQPIFSQFFYNFRTKGQASEINSQRNLKCKRRYLLERRCREKKEGPRWNAGAPDGDSARDSTPPESSSFLLLLLLLRRSQPSLSSLSRLSPSLPLSFCFSLIWFEWNVGSGETS